MFLFILTLSISSHTLFLDSTLSSLSLLIFDINPLKRYVICFHIFVNCDFDLFVKIRIKNLGFIKITDLGVYVISNACLIS